MDQIRKLRLALLIHLPRRVALRRLGCREGPCIVELLLMRDLVLGACTELGGPHHLVAPWGDLALAIVIVLVSWLHVGVKQGLRVD